jgi:hypothetical protein
MQNHADGGGGARCAPRHWLSVAFLLGFFTDLILLDRVDDFFENIILLSYTLLATVSLILFYVGVAERWGQTASSFLKRYMPLLMQYAFGALFSGMLIFYGRSGDLLASAPFYLLIAAVIFGNEIIGKRADRLIFHLALYFVGLFSYVVLMVPVLVGYMGDFVFFLSGLGALLITALLVRLLIVIIPNFMALRMRAIVFSIGGIFTLLNAFYIFNIIPPIPLSLIELRIYHAVERTAEGGYRFVGAERLWWQSLPFSPRVFHPASGHGVACFARVYAPARIEVDIFHHWEYYYEREGEWREHFRLSYPVVKSDRGYGGYTEIRNFFDGRWRCVVRTARGQVLGRYAFTIDSTRLPPALITKVE